MPSQQPQTPIFYTEQQLSTFLDDLLLRLSLSDDANFNLMLQSLLPIIIQFSIFPQPTIKLKLLKLHSTIQKRIKVLTLTMSLPLADLIMLLQHFTPSYELLLSISHINNNLHNDKITQSSLFTIQMKQCLQQITLFYIDIAVDLILVQINHVGKSGVAKTVTDNILNGLGCCLLNNISTFTHQYPSQQQQHGFDVMDGLINDLGFEMTSLDQIHNFDQFLTHFFSSPPQQQPLLTTLPTTTSTPTNYQDPTQMALSRQKTILNNFSTPTQFSASILLLSLKIILKLLSAISVGAGKKVSQKLIKIVNLIKTCHFEAKIIY
jgi:hypothetical protein